MRCWRRVIVGLLTCTVRGNLCEQGEARSTRAASGAPGQACTLPTAQLVWWIVGQREVAGRRSLQYRRGTGAASGRKTQAPVPRRHAPAQRGHQGDSASDRSWVLACVAYFLSACAANNMLRPRET